MSNITNQELYPPKSYTPLSAIHRRIGLHTQQMAIPFEDLYPPNTAIPTWTLATILIKNVLYKHPRRFSVYTSNQESHHIPRKHLGCSYFHIFTQYNCPIYPVKRVVLMHKLYSPKSYTHHSGGHQKIVLHSKVRAIPTEELYPCKSYTYPWAIP